MAERTENIQKFQTKKYIRQISDLLTLASSTLRRMDKILCKEDYALYIPPQFQVNGPFPPTINRLILLQEDPSGYLKNALKNIDPATTQWSESKLRQIPNEVFLPLVEQWIRQLSDQQRDQLMERILDHLDLSGTAKLLIYTRIDGEQVFVKKIVMDCAEQTPKEVCQNCNKGELKKACVHCGNTTCQSICQNCDALTSRTLKQSLDTFIHLRNTYYAHSDDTMIIDDQLTLSQIQKIDRLMRIFRNSPYEQIRISAEHYFEKSRRTVTNLSHPIIDLDLKETEYGLSKGSFRKFFSKNNIYADRISPDYTKLLFVSSEELDRLIPAVRYSEELEMQVGARSSTGIQSHSLQQQNLSVLPQYRSKMFSNEQLQELVSNFALFVDAQTLMSEKGLMVLKDLGNILIRKKQCLQVEWNTVLHIYQQEKESTDPTRRAIAKQARMQLYHMHHIHIIRYIDSGCYDTDPNVSLLRLLQKNSKVPACVLTADRQLISMISGTTLPNCLCLSIWAGSKLGLFLRSESAQRFRQMLGIEQPEPETPIRKPDPSSASSAKAAPPAKTVPSTRAATAHSVRPLEKVPVSGDTVYDEQMQSLRLGDILGQPGGEGSVYKTDRADTVAKIYHSDKRTQQRLDKLGVMRKIRMDLAQVCWPKSILYDREQNFVGFLMAAAAPDSLEMGLSVLKLAGQNVRTKLLPHWNRMQIIDCCITVSSTFATLHQRNILMGDVNPRNLLVSKSHAENVWFVDCDSYQVAKFTCPVGVPEYASPNMLARIEKTAGGYANCPRTLEDEQFSLAILLFQMVMLGQSPFAGKNSESIGQAIRNHAFSFKTKDNTGQGAPDGPYRLIWSNIPSFLRDMFIKTFTGEKTYPAQVWKSRFEKYREMIRNGIHTDELLPNKYYDPTGDFFLDFICDGCHEERNLPAETVDRIRKSNSPCFCNQCQAEMRRARTIPSTVTCSVCKRTVDCTLYDSIMAEDYHKPFICHNCRNPMVKCSQCGKFFPTDRHTKERIDSNEIRYPRCPDCMILYKARKRYDA